jgi:hypothetical protein
MLCTSMSLWHIRVHWTQRCPPKQSPGQWRLLLAMPRSDRDMTAGKIEIAL